MARYGESRRGQPEDWEVLLGPVPASCLTPSPPTSGSVPTVGVDGRGWNGLSLPTPAGLRYFLPVPGPPKGTVSLFRPAGFPVGAETVPTSRSDPGFPFLHRGPGSSPWTGWAGEVWVGARVSVQTFRGMDEYLARGISRSGTPVSVFVQSGPLPRTPVGVGDGHVWVFTTRTDLFQVWHKETFRGVEDRRRESLDGPRDQGHHFITDGFNFPYGGGRSPVELNTRTTCEGLSTF